MVVEGKADLVCSPPIPRCLGLGSIVIHGAAGKIPTAGFCRNVGAVTTKRRSEDSMKHQKTIGKHQHPPRQTQTNRAASKIFQQNNPSIGYER